MRGYRPIDIATREGNLSALQCFLRRGAKLGTSTWNLARNNPQVALMLLQKLIEDGSLLYKRGRHKDAAHRFNYAVRKCALLSDEDSLDEYKQQLREINGTLLLGLGRTKRRQV